MKQWGKALLLVLVLLAGLSCRRHDYKVKVLSVPDMKNDVCAEKVLAALKKANAEPGIRGAIKTDGIRVDMEARTVTVEYDSMKLALKNLEQYVADAGFKANETPADAKARAALPDACR